MPYQVLRNGQTYGPYTLEDLQRYVASGNVLLTDMAKSEDMAEWVPVSQILGASGATPGYAAPPAYGGSAAAYPAVHGIAYPDPPNLNWGLELLLGLFTCGLFVIVWNLVIAAWAKRVQPATNVLMYYIIATVLVIANSGRSYGVMIAIGHHQHFHQNLLGGLIGIASWVARLIARFMLRDTLEQHFNGPEPLGLRLSAVMTFFFGGIYFQYKLNEINQIKQGYGRGPVLR
jgi:GYF domain 2